MSLERNQLNPKKKKKKKKKNVFFLFLLVKETIFLTDNKTKIKKKMKEKFYLNFVKLLFNLIIPRNNRKIIRGRERGVRKTFKKTISNRASENFYFGTT